MKKCEHPNCYWYPLTREWYFIIHEYNIENSPGVRIYGIKYCPWCGKELNKNGKASG